MTSSQTGPPHVEHHGGLRHTRVKMLYKARHERHESPTMANSSRWGSNSSFELAVLICLWYTTSVVCNETTKLLVGLELGSQIFDTLTLTLTQLCIASFLGLLGTHPAIGLVAYKGIASSEQLVMATALAAVFTLGFIALNASMGLMHVSLAMTLRAGEPVCALLLASLLLKSEPFNVKLALALLPVVVGTGLSAFGKTMLLSEPVNINSTAVGLVMLSNICFALRGIGTKMIKAKSNPDSYNLFFQLCYLGASLQSCVVIAIYACSPDNVVIPTAVDVSKQYWTILLNGASFFAYLQLSWVVLARMNDVVAHSLCNAMRRPAAIIFSLLVTPKQLETVEILGMVMACGGTLLYGRAKLAIAAATRKDR